jgi:hypothetical protein
MQHSSHYHHRRANQGRNRVELGSQHGGNFSHEDVANHAAADSCQRAEQCRRNWPGMKETAKSASPAASNTSTGLLSRLMIRYQ